MGRMSQVWPPKSLLRIHALMSPLSELDNRRRRGVAQSCPTLCFPMDCSPPGSSVHGILQARMQEWLPFPTHVDLPNPVTEPESRASSALAGGFFSTVSTGKPYVCWILIKICACLVIQSCPTFCNHVDYSPPGSSIHGIFQARIRE